MNIKILNNIFEIITILIIIIFILKIALNNKKNNIKKEEKSLVKVNLKIRILQKLTQFLQIKNIRKISYGIVFITIFSLAIFTRIYNIDTLLNGLHVDEAGMGYDAFCIANYGVDRYLNKFPVYMINFGGGQSALYTYLSAIFVKVIGLNVIAIRMPGIVLSLLAILSGFILIKRTHGTKCGILFMCLMLVCPWHVNFIWNNIIYICIIIFNSANFIILKFNIYVICKENKIQRYNNIRHSNSNFGYSTNIDATCKYGISKSN